MSTQKTRKIVVGTRGSALALVQTQTVVNRLSELRPELDIQIKRVKTEGDILASASLVKIGGKGVFVKEIEEALLSEEIDLAVHSLKDLPTAQPRGVVIGAVCRREDPRDAFISPRYAGRSLADLPGGAVVGTSSLRRQAQLLAYRADLVIREIRGNVDTRLRKVNSGTYDAIILAAAGLLRLGHAVAEDQYLPLDIMLPAVGQGALAVEVREGDDEVLSLVRALNDPASETATQAERTFLSAFGGGCAVPIAGYGLVSGDTLTLRGMVASLDGRRLLRDELTGPGADPHGLGERLARRLLDRGADKIIGEVSVES